jgi:NADH-quinone oxidoreductase subunit M
VPMWPVHTWLPDAHVEAPTGGSLILAAIMLKMGGYGLLRFSLPITPDASHQLDWLIVSMSLIAIVYIAFVALVQQDMKKLVAYSSIAHMGFVTLGAFMTFYIVAGSGSARGAVNGLDGAMVQMISHGLISGALFLCIGVMYDRLHTREISAYGGVINVMPKFGAFAVFFALANSGVPGTSGFVGEFLVVLASFKASFWFAVLAASILVVGAAYNLWLIKRVILGPVANDHVAKMQDLNPREFLVLGVIAVSVLLLGIYPEPLLRMMEPSVQHLLHQILTSKIPVAVG